ncbi:DUF1127 domain-containing protein [Pseudomonas sp. zbq_18]|uniref:DUF1127 domain-containing protein n=1 Tax=Pseudomonadota TaxID=1224 RepID=UPI00370AC4BE
MSPPYERNEELVPQLGAGKASLLASALMLLGHWRAFSRRLSSRRGLLRLSDEQLRDIGLTRAQALGEAERPFWTLWRD